MNFFLRIACTGIFRSNFLLLFNNERLILLSRTILSRTILSRTILDIELIFVKNKFFKSRDFNRS